MFNEDACNMLILVNKYHIKLSGHGPIILPIITNTHELYIHLLPFFKSPVVLVKPVVSFMLRATA